MRKIISCLLKRHISRIQNRVRNSADRLNVCEADGQLFLTFDNIPIVAMSLMKEDPMASLQQIRRDWIRNEFNIALKNNSSRVEE